MNKLAIFVEGQTELLFMDRLLSEIANSNHLLVEHFGALGKLRTFKMVRSSQRGNPNAEHYVQIVDCHSDTTVKSYILERYPSLSNAGFWAAIGIRDVFPNNAYAQINSLRAGLANGMRQNPVRVEFILGVMEIESWFIAEHTHFERISPLLTNTSITAAMGYNPITADLEQRPNPADDLHRIYGIAGMSYTKRRRDCERIIKNFDFALIYCELVNRFSDFRRLIQIINDFISL
jgi:hypothetical protein